MLMLLRVKQYQQTLAPFHFTLDHNSALIDESREDGKNQARTLSLLNPVKAFVTGAKQAANKTTSDKEDEWYCSARDVLLNADPICFHLPSCKVKTLISLPGYWIVWSAFSRCIENVKKFMNLGYAWEELIDFFRYLVVSDLCYQIKVCYESHCVCKFFHNCCWHLKYIHFNTT